jgi:hypothetical protein
MGQVDQPVEPYAYPGEAHERRHGPTGYADYQSYRPWLEDEFSFRCVYCLKRMVWAPTDIWVIDHLISQDKAPHLECDYDNLVFACQFCNRWKGPNRVPDPCQVAYGACLRVEADGQVTALNSSGHRLVTVLRLNHERYVKERLKQMQLLSLLARHDKALFERLMGFPSELPDLEGSKLPYNRRPQGIAESHYAKRQRGELPAVY